MSRNREGPNAGTVGIGSETIENASLNVGIGKKKKDKNDKNLIDPK